MLAAPLFQAAPLEAAMHAVVRIRMCTQQSCNQGVGSGVIIDPSGLILTAHHVTLSNPHDRMSRQLEDFIIEVTDNARLAPAARYRARVVAQKPDADLALLRVYWDVPAGRPVEGADLDLPYLTFADPDSLTLSDEHFYPGLPTGGWQQHQLRQ